MHRTSIVERDDMGDLIKRGDCGTHERKVSTKALERKEVSIMVVVSLRPVSIIFDPKVTPQDATHIGNKYINTEDKIAC